MTMRARIVVPLGAVAFGLAALALSRSSLGDSFTRTPELPTTKDATSLVLILDTSGSMDEKVAGGESKLECAKHVLTEDFLPLLADDLHVALYRFAEADTVELSPLRKNGSRDAPRWTHREAVMELVDTTKAAGGTPIVASLRQARGVLGKLPGRRIVVLVTDGEESYGTKDDVLSQVRGARTEKIETFVVGFNLGSQGGYLKDELVLGKAYFEANGGRASLLAAMESILAKIEK